MDWLFWTVYFIGVIPAWRVMFVQGMKMMKKHDSYDDSDRPFAAFLSGIMCWLWPLSPLILVGWLVIKTPTPDERREKRKKEHEEREREMMRIAQDIEDQRRKLENERIRVAEEYNRLYCENRLSTTRDKR